MEITSVPSQYSVFFWCIRGMTKARIVLTDEDGQVHGRNLEIHELLQIREGLDEAIRRVTHGICDELGHHPVTVGDRCARCGSMVNSA
jgi:hypothetical protein